MQQTIALGEVQPSPESKTRVIAAIPCFNTGPFVQEVIRKTRKYVDEVVIVDDGSSDDTGEIARANEALVLSHSVNRGYGEAIKSCFHAARENAADVLVILDGDGQHDPDEIPRLLDLVLNSEADLVIGSRFLNGNGSHPVPAHTECRSNMPRYRKFGIGVITSLFNIGAGTKVSDTQSGFRVYGKRVLGSMTLIESGMGVSIEILAKARKSGLAIKEVPISCRYFQSNMTKKAVKHGLRVALDVLRIRLKNRV